MRSPSTRSPTAIVDGLREAAPRRSARGRTAVPADLAHARARVRAGTPEIRRLSAEQSQQLAGHRRRAGAEARPPRLRRAFIPEGEMTPLPDRARLSPTPPRCSASWCASMPTARRTRRPRARLRAQSGRRLDLDARLPCARDRGDRGHRRRARGARPTHSRPITRSRQ